MAIPTGSKVISTAKKYVRRASYGWCNRFTKWYGFGNQSVSWCGCFVYYVLCKAGAKSLTAGCSNFAYVPAIHEWAKAKGYITHNPQKGDIIIFDWGHDGTRDHVGFFISRAGSGLVNTVEGNTSSVSAGNGGCVQLKVRRTYDILAFIHLPYAKSSSSSASNDRTQVKRLQKCMNKILGTKLTVDGIYGVQSRAAVKRFQKKHGLTVDGIVGPATRSKIKSVLAKSSSSSASKSTAAKRTRTKATPAYPTATIWYGSSNDRTQVKRLQKCMNKILGTKLTVDGIYGVQSLAAVKRFQKKYGRTVDGIVGPATRSKIKSVLAKSSSSSASKSTAAKRTKSTPAYPTATIWYGSSNDRTQVKRLQKCMNKILGTKLTVDGIYGVQSLAAVKRFQKKYGRTVDGIVGPATRSKIKSVLAKKK